MLGLPGAYLTDVQGALDQINAIRYEACEEGVRDPRTGEALTLDDYVPIRWSGDLEYIARIRAAEAAVTWDHIRTNGNRWLAISRNGVSASGEVLAWNNSSSVIYGINQWYGEKSAWVNQTGGVTGHYTSMIDPANRYVGIGTFLSNNTRWFNSTAGEFSRSSSLNETPLNIEDTDCIQILEVNAGLLSGTPTIRGTLTGKAGDESALYVTTNANNGITTKNLLVMDDITWSSDDTNAATVSADGVVKAKACGDPVITAKVRNVLTAQAVYAIEHTWKDGASFTWEADYSAATATFTCANKSSHKKTVDATVTSKVTKEATDTTEGLMVYTATVTFNGKTYTDSVEKTIPRLDHMHTYSNPVWTWSADYKTAKAQFTCSGCGDVKKINANVTSVRYEPTCTAEGSETFTAKVSFEGKSYTDTRKLTYPALGHQDDGTGRCSRCGTVLVNLSSTTPDLVNTAKGIKLTFKKVDGATHYEICRRLKSSEKGEPVETSFTLVTTIPATINNSTKINYYDSATATGKNGNTYVYYIRPVIMDNGSVTIAGPTKSVQVRRVSTPEIKSCVNSGAGKVTIKWSKNSLATGYDVWYSDGKNKTTIRINGIATVSKVIIGLTKGKTYTFKVRSFYKTSSGTIYKSAWKPAEVYISK